ncbi:MAG: DUF4249 domain-containing protein [Bacteroidota bacterium]
MRNLAILISLVVVLAGCDEAIKLDLNQTPPKLVIEGQLTDIPGLQFVRVTRSLGFYQAGNAERVSNAVVTISDDAGGQVQFIHNPGGSEDSVGYYRPVGSYVGTIGRTYTMTVLLDASTYTSSDKLLRVTSFDSLSYQPNRFLDRDRPSDGKYIELLMYAKEPQETEDNYLFKFYRNDSLIYTNPTDVYIFNDYGIGERIDGVASPVYYAPGDTARVEMYSITRDGYLFYNDLATILNSDGGMFSPPPANPRSNITGGALGFFQVSSRATAGVILKKSQ